MERPVREGVGRPRLLVTGGGGFVAGSVIRQGLSEWEVHVLSRGSALIERPGLHWHKGSLLDGGVLRSLFDAAAPRAVVHTAAMANIDRCEEEQAEAAAVNTDATVTLAELCVEKGAKLVYLSTDNAFDGERGMYRESDLPSPINFYGETKVRAEEAVRAASEDFVIARVALVTGLHMVGAGNSFLSWMLESFEAGRVVGVPENEIRTTIDVVTLGRALLELAGNEVSGNLHLAGNDRMNRCEMVRRVAGMLGYPPELVEPNDRTEIPGRAPRPLDVSLDNSLARRVLKTPMCGLEAGVNLVLAERERDS